MKRTGKPSGKKTSRKTVADTMLTHLQQGVDVRKDKVKKVRAALRRGDYLTDFKMAILSDRVLDVLAD